MLPVPVTKTQNREERDGQTKDKPTKKKNHNYTRRRQLCSNYNCYKVAKVKGLCDQHFKEHRKPKQSTIDSQMDDFFPIEDANFKSKKRNYLEEEGEINSDGKIL